MATPCRLSRSAAETTSIASDNRRYFGSNASEDAVEVVKQAIRIKPDNAEACANLGDAYRESSRHREAVQASQQAIQIRPNHADAHHFLGLS